jgi:hypothetical protein
MACPWAGAVGGGQGRCRPCAAASPGGTHQTRVGGAGAHRPRWARTCGWRPSRPPCRRGTAPAGRGHRRPRDGSRRLRAGGRAVKGTAVTRGRPARGCMTAFDAGPCTALAPAQRQQQRHKQCSSGGVLTPALPAVPPEAASQRSGVALVVSGPLAARPGRQLCFQIRISSHQLAQAHLHGLLGLLLLARRRGLGGLSQGGEGLGEHAILLCLIYVVRPVRGGTLR